MCALSAEVPTVDLKVLTSENGRPQLSRHHPVIQVVVQTASDGGMLQLIGHGIPEALTSNCLSVATKFFLQNIESKLATRSDSVTSSGYAFHDSQTPGRSLKETFDVGPTAEPSMSTEKVHGASRTLEDFRGVLDAYYREMERLEAVVNGLFSLALAQAADIELPYDFLETSKGRHRGRLRINYYPEYNSAGTPGELRDGAHTDWTPFTLLLQEKPGLELFQEGSWRPVTLNKNALVVNIGEQLHRWSNGRFKASLHQVNERYFCKESRLSFAYFATEWVDRTDDSKLLPVCAVGEVPKFAPIAIRDYLLHKFTSFQRRTDL